MNRFIMIIIDLRKKKLNSLVEKNGLYEKILKESQKLDKYINLIMKQQRVKK